MTLSRIKKYIALTYATKKLVLSSAMNYRVSFVSQVLGMFFNDTAWIVLWYIFFKSFPSVNGWGFEQTLILFAFGSFVSFLCEFPFEGLTQLSRYIVTGELDIYLTMPQHVLWSVAMSKSEIAAIGDGLFGLIVMVYLYGFAPLKIAWFFLVCSCATVLVCSFTLIIQTLAFWLGDIEDMAKRVMHMIFGFTVYPQSIFTGAIKIITMTVLPVFFMITVPINLIIEPSVTLGVTLCVSVIFGSSVAWWFFKKGLAGYESGSIVTTRL